MKVYIEFEWVVLKEIPDKNGVEGLLQFKGKITDELADYLRKWYFDIMSDANGGPKHYKKLPFAGNEFGVYNMCKMEAIGSTSKMHTWQIFYGNKKTQE